MLRSNIASACSAVAALLIYERKLFRASTCTDTHSTQAHTHTPQRYTHTHSTKVHTHAYIYKLGVTHTRTLLHKRRHIYTCRHTHTHRHKYMPAFQKHQIVFLCFVSAQIAKQPFLWTWLSNLADRSLCNCLQLVGQARVIAIRFAQSE